MKYHNISQLIQKAKNNNGGDWSKLKGRAMIINHPNRFPVFSTKTLKKTDWKLQQESSHLQKTKNKKECEKTDFITLGWAALPEEEEEEEEEKVQLQTYKQRWRNEEMKEVEETSAFYTPFIGH